MKIGYIRINPTEENSEELLEQFKAGKDLQRLYWEKISVKDKERPEYDKMMNYLRAGDEIVLPEFARFNKTLIELVKTIEQLNERGIEVISEKEDFNSGTEEGKFKLKVLQSAAEFEKTLIKQRQKEGIAAAKAAGKYKGYNEKEIPADFEDFRDLYYMNEISVSDMAEHYGVSRPTIYKWIRQLSDGDKLTEQSGMVEDIEELESLGKLVIPNDPSIYDEPEIIIERREIESENKIESELLKNSKSKSPKKQKSDNPSAIGKNGLPGDFEAFRKLYHDNILDIDNIMAFYNKSRKTIKKWLEMAGEKV